MRATLPLIINSPAILLYLGKLALEPVSLRGREGVNNLFHYELLLQTTETLNIGASKAEDWSLDEFIGRKTACSPPPKAGPRRTST